MIARKRWWLSLLAAAASVSAASATLAQAYPTKPIRMIVPFAAGGPNDVIARMLGQQVAAAWNGTVVIDNRTGAGGNIGTSLVAKAAPDGYTLLLAGLHLVVNPSFYSNAGYGLEKDFAAVTNVAVSPVGIAAHPSLAARDMRELAALAKKSALDYGSPGTGTAGHLAGELFTLAAGIKMQHLPYKGAAPAIADVLGGQIKLSFTAFPALPPHVKAGRLRALAVTTLKRSPALPEVPTVAESGYPGFFVDNIYALAVPRGTPPAVIARWHQAAVQVVNMPDIRERLITQGYDPLANSPAEFAAYLRSESAKWARVVRETGLRVE